MFFYLIASIIKLTQCSGLSFDHFWLSCFKGHFKATLQTHKHNISSNEILAGVTQRGVNCFCWGLFSAVDLKPFCVRWCHICVFLIVFGQLWRRGKNCITLWLHRTLVSINSLMVLVFYQGFVYNKKCVKYWQKYASRTAGPQTALESRQHKTYSTLSGWKFNITLELCTFQQLRF